MKFYKLNLQLFAEETYQHNWTGLEGLSVEMKTYYDKNLLRAAQPNLIHEQFGQKRPIPKNGGKKIEFRTFASLPKALTPLTEGVTPKGSKLSATAIYAEVLQYGDFVEQTDVLELTTIDNTILEATKALGNQAGLTLDTVVREVINGGTNAFFAPKIAADGTKTEITERGNLTKDCKMTANLVKRIVAFLKGNNAPKIDGYYVGIIHPYVAFDLMTDPEWMEVQKYATPENMLKGEIGRLAGCRFVESTESKIFFGADDECPEGLAVFSTLFMGADAYGVTEVTGGGLETIVKQKGSAGTADPLNQRSSIGWKAMRTAEILFEPYLVRCESCSEFSSSIKEAN